MRTLARFLFTAGIICLLVVAYSLFAEASFVVPSKIDVGEIVAGEQASREMVVRNLAPWQVRILGGQFG